MEEGVLYFSLASIVNTEKFSSRNFYIKFVENASDKEMRLVMKRGVSIPSKSIIMSRFQ